MRVVNLSRLAAVALPTMCRADHERALIVATGSFAIPVTAGGSLLLFDEQRPPALSDEFHGDPTSSSLRREGQAVYGRPGTDIYLRGHAWAPQGRPASESDLYLRVGPCARHAIVFGERVWVRTIGSIRASPPASFERMPIVWERSFGGTPKTLRARSLTVAARNPVGCGLFDDSAEAADRPLPNFEDPGALISSLDDRPMPVGFGPIARHWQPRRGPHPPRPRARPPQRLGPRLVPRRSRRRSPSPLTYAAIAMSKPDVYANGRSVVHAGDGLEHACAPPDTCNTPTPGGPPQPVPYLNVGKSSDLRGGSTSVKIAGNSIALAGAELSSTSGDEPGTLGGLVSGKNRGKAGWVPGVAGSENVFVEGKAIIRFLDPILHNGNTYNSAFKTPGKTTEYAYADDFDGLCPICSHGPERHRIHEYDSTVDLANRLIGRLQDARKVRGSQVTRKGRGFMVGVMICKCKQTWAAMSGEVTTQGFRDIAKDVVDNVIDSGVVTMEQLWAANKSTRAATGFTAFKETWKQTKGRNKAGWTGYLPPGVCAASKLLATDIYPWQ